jgi:hypothetical protein
MKRISLALLLTVLMVILGCGAGNNGRGSQDAWSTQSLVNHEGKSTVALVYTDYDNDDDKVSDQRVFCSAVWVDDTHILTAYHCVKAVREILQQRQDLREKNAPVCEGFALALGLCDNTPVPHKEIATRDMHVSYVQWKESEGIGQEPSGTHLSKVVGWDVRHDLALLQAVGGAIPVHENAHLAAQVPGLLQPVHVVGHPHGFYWTFLEGTVAGYVHDIPAITDEDGPYLQIQAPIYFGNSGGGAFNDVGELIGIADFTSKLPGEGFFIPVVSLRSFLVAQHLLAAPVPVKVTKSVVGVGVGESK